MRSDSKRRIISKGESSCYMVCLLFSLLGSFISRIKFDNIVEESAWYYIYFMNLLHFWPLH